MLLIWSISSEEIAKYIMLTSMQNDSDCKIGLWNFYFSCLKETSTREADSNELDGQDRFGASSTEIKKINK